MRPLFPSALSILLLSVSLDASAQGCESVFTHNLLPQGVIETGIDPGGSPTFTDQGIELVFDFFDPGGGLAYGSASSLDATPEFGFTRILALNDISAVYTLSQALPPASTVQQVVIEFNDLSPSPEEIRINDAPPVFWNITDLMSAPNLPLAPGVEAQINMAPGSNAVGKLILTGVIQTVKLGGANLQLDDVCINPDGDPNGGGGTGVPGCTYDEASNFNPEATEDDGSCQFGSNGTPGCTYATAVNYNPFATIEDGSCTFPGAEVERLCEIGFEHLLNPPGPWNPSPTVVASENDIDLQIGTFVYNDGTEITTGSAEFTSPPQPFGDGNVLQLENTTALYDLSALENVGAVVIEFMDNGGQERLVLDGVSYTFQLIYLELLTAIIEEVPFGDYVVSAYAEEIDGYRIGQLVVKGHPGLLGFGGEALWLDNLCALPCRWVQVGQDIYGEAKLDYSGVDLSTSADGRSVAIGASWNDGGGDRSGHVRVFDYDWPSASWVQRGQDIDGIDEIIFSGLSNSLSADGQRVATGAERYGTGLIYSIGHVSVHEYDPTSGMWVQMGQDLFGVNFADQFGQDVSLSADGLRVAASANGHDGDGTDIGQVRVFDYDGASGEWVQVGADILGEADNDRSGVSISLSADGQRLAVGAEDNDGGGSNSGHVRVFEYDATAGWQQLGADIDGAAAGDKSGGSVSLSANGSLLAVGARFSDENGTSCGHVKVYEYDSATASWTQVGQTLTGDVAGDQMGGTVSLSGDGMRLAAAAKESDIAGIASGEVKVFDYEPSTGLWEQVSRSLVGSIADDRCGEGLHLSADGQRVAVGSKYNDLAGTNVGQTRLFDLCSAPDGASSLLELADAPGMFISDRFRLDGQLLEGSCWMALDIQLPDFILGDSTLATMVQVGNGGLTEVQGLLEPITGSGSYLLDVASIDPTTPLQLQMSSPDTTFIVPDVSLMAPPCGPPNAEDCPDVDADGLVGVGDILMLLASYGNVCP